MTNKEFNSRIESLKTSINKGNFGITPEFVKKLAEAKNEMQQDTVNKNVTPIITIDSLNLSDVDLIHLDLEGYELFALQGAIETIKRYKPLIVLETNDLCNEFGYTINELESWIYSVGYKKTKAWADDCAYEYDTTVL